MQILNLVWAVSTSQSKITQKLYNSSKMLKNTTKLQVAKQTSTLRPYQT